MNKYIIKNCRIVLKDSILKQKYLVVNEGIIENITEDINPYHNFRTIDANDGYVTPGLVELHIHGCSDIDLSTDINPVIKRASDFLRKKGINIFVPTFQCNETILNKISKEIIIGNFPENHIPGIYVEGPFINKDKKGGIFTRHLKEPNIDYLKKLIDLTNGKIKLMTIAPELEGIKHIVDFLLKRDIICCLGHSNCDIDDIRNLFFEGELEKMNITHLFNTMSSISHKRSGLATLPFINENIFYELNSDGIHLDKDVIRMCYKFLNHNKLILISDAQISAGTKHGEYTYFSEKVISDNTGVRYKQGNTLIGSNLLIDDMLRNFLSITNAPIHEAIKFATYNPCKLLGIDHKKGSIEIGKDSDLIIWDKDMNIVNNLIDF